VLDWQDRSIARVGTPWRRGLQVGERMARDGWTELDSPRRLPRHDDVPDAQP
jgi:hypothetical protein